MNTNRAKAYSPEQIAIREQEGMLLCDDCLTEMYAPDMDSHKNPANNWLHGGCPGGLEYADNYAAAPELPSWSQVTQEDLDAVQRDLADATVDGAQEVHIANLETDRNGVAWALEQAARRDVMMTQDEDGYYFATVVA